MLSHFICGLQEIKRFPQCLLMLSTSKWGIVKKKKKNETLQFV